MDMDSRRPKHQDRALSLLSAAIEAMNLAKEVSSMTPAKAVFGSVSILLAMIRVRIPPFYNGEPQVYTHQDSLANETDYVDLGLACADVCKALGRGMSGKQVDELSQSVLEAVGQLTT